MLGAGVRCIQSSARKGKHKNEHSQKRKVNGKSIDKCRVWLRLEVNGFGYRVHGLGYRVQGFGVRVSRFQV